jgi:hypothetical protein
MVYGMSIGDKTGHGEEKRTYTAVILTYIASMTGGPRQPLGGLGAIPGLDLVNIVPLWNYIELYRHKYWWVRSMG